MYVKLLFSLPDCVLQSVWNRQWKQQVKALHYHLTWLHGLLLVARYWLCVDQWTPDWSTWTLTVCCSVSVSTNSCRCLPPFSLRGGSSSSQTNSGTAVGMQTAAGSPTHHFISGRFTDGTEEYWVRIFFFKNWASLLAVCPLKSIPD